MKRSLHERIQFKGLHGQHQYLEKKILEKTPNKLPMKSMEFTLSSHPLDGGQGQRRETGTRRHC